MPRKHDSDSEGIIGVTLILSHLGVSCEFVSIGDAVGSFSCWDRFRSTSNGIRFTRGCLRD